MKKEYLEIIKEMTENQKHVRNLEDAVSNSKKLLIEKLKEEYGLLIEKEKFNFSDNSWDISYDLLTEMNLLLRSSLKTNKVFKISAIPGKQMYITQQHGLKYPRRHSCFDFIPGRNSKPLPVFKDKILDFGYNQPIDFNLLKDRNDFDQIKVEKFCLFLERIFELWNEWKKMIDETALSKIREELKETRSLSYYSEIEDFKTFIDKAPSLMERSVRLFELMRVADKKEKDLLEEIKVFNRPFRVFLKLKEPERDID